MKYPKPGYPNPLVSIHIFSLATYDPLSPDPPTRALAWDNQLAPEDQIIMEVAWIDNSTLIVKEVNRAADIGNVILFDFENSGTGGRGKVVRKLGAKGEEHDDGWINSAQYIYPLPHTPGTPSAYLDLVPNSEGYNHIALFSPADSSVPRWLTTGKWEVVDGIKGVDTKKGLVYFISTTTSSTERQLYSVSLPTTKAESSTAPIVPTALTDSRSSGYYHASFSPRSGFYLLSYEGPNVPWQRIVQAGNSTFNRLLTDNKSLNETFKEYQTPTITRFTIESDGYELNAMELRPPGMDDSGRTKYPVLFRVYGGPDSQLVDTRFSIDWHHYLACSLKYVIVVVDGRGTGFKGRKHRNPIRGNLGYYEVIDQVNAARQWATKRYVDTKRIGIWGWSYGGYMTTKVMENGAGVHSLGMAVAPVISWRMYDSIYTERVMKLPATNPDGYHNASVTNVTAFNNVNFLLAHGSGDDNVHFANSAHLIDMFTQARIRNYRFRMFTDSAHSMSVRSAYRELHEWMTAFLIEKWGKGGTRRGWRAS
jgi:dipeptidyl aminopeptidase